MVRQRRNQSSKTTDDQNEGDQTTVNESAPSTVRKSLNCTSTIGVVSSPSQINRTKKVSSAGWWHLCCGKFKYVLLVLIVPPFLNYASLQQEQQLLRPEGGELYDVGWGQKMFLYCQGDGPPTVVFDAPTGMTSDVWSLIWPKIAVRARVCLYDRGGLGFSERPYQNRSELDGSMQNEGVNYRNRWQPFTAERMVEDLHQLLMVSSQQPQPLLLVGAELGALVAQFYTQLYDREVLGMVLINPLSDTLFQQDGGLWASYWFGQLLPTYQSLQLGAALGITRLALLFGLFHHPLSGAPVSDEVHKRQKFLLCHPRHISSIVDEHHFINDTFSQMKTVRMLRSVPSNISVTLITGNYYDEQMPSALNKAWAKAEQNLISSHLSSAQHIVINTADHHMLYRKPQALIDPILKLVRQWQEKNPAKSKPK